MPDQSADRLEMIAAARLRVALDHRLGRPTPHGVIRLSLSAQDLDDYAESSQAKDTEPRWADEALPSAEPSRRRYVAAGLPAIPLLLVIVLEAWWRADSPVALLVATGAAVVAGVLPVYLLGRLLSTGIWSAASPTLLTGAWLGLVPGALGDKIGADAFGAAVTGAVIATALIAALGAVQTAVGVPWFATRLIHDSPDTTPIGLHPLVRYGMAAAGYGAGSVLYSVLAGWPMSAGGFDLGLFAVTGALTALAYTVAAVGIQLAATLVLRKPPRFGPATLGTTFVLLTLWQLAVLGNSWWQLAACVVVLAAVGCLTYLVRRDMLPLNGYVEP